jgi:RNA chaperone Hfq
MMTTKNLLQDTFLRMILHENTLVRIYLKNGLQLQGYIRAIDEDVVLLSSQFDQIIYRHAIATILPSQAIKDAGPQRLQPIFDDVLEKTLSVSD